MRLVSRPGIRRLMAGSMVSVLAAGGAVASAGAASAGTTITIRYPVTGSTHLAAPNADLPLGPGKLTATADLTTGAITAALTLPDATGSFREFGLIPVTATAHLVNDGPTTGTLNLSTGVVSTTSVITMRLVDLKVAGIDVPVGSACETSAPVTVSVTSQPGFSIVKGGNLSGTYTIPPFANCGLSTLLINFTLPGSGNTITLTLGKGKIVP